MSGFTTSDAGPRTRGHIPGEPGLWVFVFADLLTFAILFGVVVWLRADDPTAFVAAQSELEPTFGAVNTLLLLTGSLLVVVGVQDARRGGPRAAGLLAAAIACGAGFVLVKALEWSRHFSGGLGPSTNEFTGVYFMVTGIHLAHVLIGLGVLIAMLRAVGRGRPRMSFLEGGACYWHLVDLLWVVLFPLLYLLR